MLDTFPYAGSTTSCEALWMGVPLMTLRGNTHVGRIGVSLLSRLGLGALVANCTSEYVQLAKELAGDMPRLQNNTNGLATGHGKLCTL